MSEESKLTYHFAAEAERITEAANLMLLKNGSRMIREFRDSLGLDQRQCAKVLGITKCMGLQD